MVQQVSHFAGRVFQHESFRRGIAAAGAGAIVAIICEVAWPTQA